VADRADRRWCGRDEIAALGLPAPVRTLLDNLPEISP
jgi:A/G-specific adenine glycosylase